ncbi:MAG: signal recognition particle-docking protein FtsY [Phycisphaerales bacterium]|nr:signal recognition particle-docking protein FtsY [Phycisphaerales bacterium]
MGLFSSTFGALKRGLGRTNAVLGTGLVSRMRGRDIDEELIDEIEAHLLRSDVGVQSTEGIVTSLRTGVKQGHRQRGEDAIEFLKSQLVSRFADVDTTLRFSDTAPTVILVAGVNGVGKTTSIAKLAAALQDDGHSVLLAAGDTFRAAAAEQLATWARRLGVDIVRGNDGADPASVVYDALDAARARDIDIVLVDTAGRMHNEDGLMRQLGKIRDVLERQCPGAPHEVLLVLDATQGQNALVQARQFNEAIDVSGIFLTKLDGTARGGIVVAIWDELGIPIKLVGLGERPEDLAPFEPEIFIEAMFAEGDDPV